MFYCLNSQPHEKYSSQASEILYFHHQTHVLRGKTCHLPGTARSMSYKVKHWSCFSAAVVNTYLSMLSMELFSELPVDKCVYTMKNQPTGLPVQKEVNEGKD
jgi:hypothetical protein